MGNNYSEMKKKKRLNQCQWYCGESENEGIHQQGLLWMSKYSEHEHQLQQ